MELLLDHVEFVKIWFYALLGQIYFHSPPDQVMGRSSSAPLPINNTLCASCRLGITVYHQVLEWLLDECLSPLQIVSSLRTG